MVLDPRRSDFPDRFREHFTNFTNMLDLDIGERHLGLGNYRIPIISGTHHYDVDNSGRETPLSIEVGTPYHGEYNVEIPHETGHRTALLIGHVRPKEGTALASVNTSTYPLSNRVKPIDTTIHNRSAFDIHSSAQSLRALLGEHFKSLNERIREEPEDYERIARIRDLSTDSVHRGRALGVHNVGAKTFGPSELVTGTFDMTNNMKFTEKMRYEHGA
jgi:hypothetical protein